MNLVEEEVKEEAALGIDCQRPVHRRCAGRRTRHLLHLAADQGERAIAIDLKCRDSRINTRRALAGRTGPRRVNHSTLRVGRQEEVAACISLARIELRQAAIG